MYVLTINGYSPVAVGQMLEQARLHGFARDENTVIWYRRPFTRRGQGYYSLENVA
jgi:hypothetical protein